MTRKKAPRRKKTPSRRKSTPKIRRGIQLLKSGLAVALLVVVVVSIGLLAHLLKETPPEAKKGRAPSTPKQTPTPKATTPNILYEHFPQREPPPSSPQYKPRVEPLQGLPKVAIIIDDIGYDIDMVDKFLALDTVLTFALLPQSPFQQHIVEAVHDHGYELMLHQPMEPNEYPRINPGPGALLTSMNPDELIAQLTRNIDAIPHVKGVNNHMGSKLTTS